jgi:hypothetical protein
MDLAQRLAENILRFNTKNLNSSAIVNIKRLAEQTDPAAALPKTVEELNDSEQVKAAPGYAEVMGELIKLANKRKGSSTEVKALQYWMGSVSNDKYVKATDIVINAYNVINTKFNASIYKTSADPKISKGITAQQLQQFLVKLGELVAELQKKKQGNVYINVASFLKTSYNNLAAVAKQKNLKIGIGQDFDSYLKQLINPQYAALKEITKLVTDINSLGSDGKELVPKTAITSISDADKIQLLDAAQKQIAAHKEKKKIGGGLGSVDSIVISPVAEFNSVLRTVTPVPNADGTVPITKAYTVPDISNGNNAELQNFLLDNIARPSEQQKQRFAEVLQAAVDSFKAQKITITKIGYNAGATTSQVWTRYQGDGQALAAQSSRENNEKLVADRVRFINETLKSVIEANPAVNKLEITELPNSAKANLGPEYGKDSAGAFGEGGVRWKFVKNTAGQYVIDPAQKAAYEAMYAPYRMSFGAFTLFGTVTPPPGGDETVDYTGTGKWKIKLVWDTIKLPPLVPPSGGTVSVYPTQGNGVACPINF